MSTSANVVTLRPADEWSDRLAGLLERRAELEGEMRVVSAPEATRAAAAASLAQAEAGLRSLDEAERSAWVAWAENPTDEQPAPRVDERHQLERSRALSAADLRGADAALSAIQGRLASLSAEMRQLGPQIYACRLEAIMAEVPAIEKQILDSHRQMHEQIARFKGLHIALAEEKAAASSRGDQATATLLQETSAHLESLKQPPPAPNWGVTLEHAAAWRAALR
jgi:hypothetical protein